MLKKSLSQLNLPAQCRRYGLSLWQCPQFLFLVMGAVIIITAIVSYLIGSRYITEPSLVALIDITVTTSLFIISFIITRSFEKLAEASQMKTEFIDIVSHQLRSPLTNLKWGIEFLGLGKMDLPSAKKKEYFNNLQENVARMIELVDDLLVVSRIEQGTIQTIRKEVCLEDMIKKLIARSSIFADASNVKIKLYPQKNVPRAFIDLSQIKLVIENLIDNAIRYTRGKGDIEIYIEKNNKKEVLVKIKDSGVGIPEKDKRFIFQKFYRASNVLKQQTRGSGLGLFVVKSIIKKAKGRIWFESQEGKGTTFFFTLPTK